MTQQIIDYEFSGGLGVIFTDRDTICLDWRCLKNILESEGEIRGKEIKYIDEQIYFQ